MKFFLVLSVLCLGTTTEHFILTLATWVCYVAFLMHVNCGIASTIWFLPSKGYFFKQCYRSVKCGGGGWENRKLLKPLQNDTKCFYAQKGHQTLPSILSAEISGQWESLFQQGLLIISILLPIWFFMRSIQHSESLSEHNKLFTEKNLQGCQTTKWIQNSKFRKIALFASSKCVWFYIFIWARICLQAVLISFFFKELSHAKLCLKTYAIYEPNYDCQTMLKNLCNM